MFFQVDPGIFQAAADAAKAAQASSSATPGPSASVDWPKLLNKSCAFDSTTDDEIKAFPDWYWQLGQLLVATYAGFENEWKSLADDPTKSLDMSSASEETRKRGAKLYGLLTGRARNRAPTVDTAVIVVMALRHFDPRLKAEVWPCFQQQFGQSSL